MTVVVQSATASHVGRVRSNNQDSGYCGDHLFLVADGMGGHAGGDVASAVTLNMLVELDAEYDSPEQAAEALKRRLLEANAELRRHVLDHPELAGMGTTVSGMITVGDKVAIAHIGDSRIYLFREDELTQITSDHTFVQRLVDSGRITKEEAASHPRRSVLMRVLGDVDSSPEVDTLVMTAQPGDVWMACSDGLSDYVPQDEVLASLRSRRTLQSAVDQMVDKALSHGAPDNVTIVLAEFGDAAAPPVPLQRRIVGSAAQPVVFQAEETPADVRPITRRLIPRRAPIVEQTHFEPVTEDYLDELVAQQRRRNLRRRLVGVLAALLVVLLVLLGLFLGYQWTQTRYYVGTDGSSVIIYRGIQQNVGPFSLSSVYEQTGIPLSELRTYDRQKVEQTISADSLEAAQDIVERLGTEGG